MSVRMSVIRVWSVRLSVWVSVIKVWSVLILTDELHRIWNLVPRPDRRGEREKEASCYSKDKHGT